MAVCDAALVRGGDPGLVATGMDGVETVRGTWRTAFALEAAYQRPWVIEDAIAIICRC